MSTSPSSSVSVSGRELPVEVDPETSALCVSGTRVESQRGWTIIVPLLSWAETVTVPTGVIERTGVLPKEVSGEVVESTEAADEGRSCVSSVMGSSLVSGVMSNQCWMTVRDGDLPERRTCRLQRGWNGHSDRSRHRRSDVGGHEIARQADPSGVVRPGLGVERAFVLGFLEAYRLH